MTVGPGGKILAAENRLHDAATGRLLRTLRDNLEVAAFSPDGKRLAATVSHGPRDAAAILDVETGETLVTLKVLDDVNWIAVTPDGHFAGTLDARRTVSWRANGEVFPLELYVDVFFRPDIVSAAFLGNRRPERFPTGTPPVPAGDILALLADSVPVRLVATRAPALASAKSARLRGRARCLAVVQGTPVAREGSADGRGVHRPDRLPARKTDRRRRRGRLRRGRPQVPPWIVSRQARRRSRPNAASSSSRSASPTTGGLRRVLPHADAEALAAHFETQKGRAPSSVKTTLLTDRAATAGAIRHALGDLRDGCGPADVALVLVSGHGVRDADSALYYVPITGRRRRRRGDLPALERSGQRSEEREIRVRPALRRHLPRGCVRPGRAAVRPGGVARERAQVLVFASSRT